MSFLSLFKFYKIHNNLRLNSGSAIAQNDYISPVKRTNGFRTKKKTPQASKRIVDLNVNKSNSKENLKSMSKFESPTQMKHSLTHKSTFSNKKFIGSDTEHRNGKKKIKKVLNKSSTHHTKNSMGGNARYDY